MLSFNALAQSQYDRFGIQFGLTNYITDTNMLFSKSDTGFTFGVVGTKSFSKRFELSAEINLSQHRVKFIGRETQTSDPEEIKFKLEEVSIPFILNYNYLLLEDFKFGINLGPSVHFIHNFVLIDDSKESFYLDPLLTKTKNVEFDTYSAKEDISFNMFLAMGLNVQYNESLMASLRYYYGITDPYRRAPIYSPLFEISGKDSYYSFTMTYFF